MNLMETRARPFGSKTDAVFAPNGEAPMDTPLALEQAKMQDKVVVSGAHVIPHALQAVKAGQLDAAVFRDARGQGHGAVKGPKRIIARPTR